MPEQQSPSAVQSPPTPMQAFWHTPVNVLQTEVEVQQTEVVVQT